MGASQSTLNDSAISQKSVKNKHNTSHNNGNAEEELLDEPMTAFEQFLSGYVKSGDRPCIGCREPSEVHYTWRTYKDVLMDINSIGAYLTENLGQQKGAFIGTLCTNCPELLVLELACYAYGFVIVPLYDTLGNEACAHIIKEAELKVIFCKGSKQINLLMDLADKLGDDDLGGAFTLLTAEKFQSGFDAKTAARVAKITSYAEIIACSKTQQHLMQSHTAGGAAAATAEPPMPNVMVQPDDLAVICYTSGTTGQPKGVMLTNRNLAHGVNLVTKTFGQDSYHQTFELTNEDVYFSYLPMAHILERMCLLMSLKHGMAIGFFSGDRSLLMSDLQACRPTFMAAVPKIVSRIYDGAFAAAGQSKLKSMLFNMALRRKYKAVTSLQVNRNSIWDRVLHRLQSSLGGRLRLMAVGGAPISEDALRFAKAAFGCYVVQGFGQTETCGLGMCQRPGDPSADSIGQPMCGCEVKLIDAPEQGYFASSGCGQVCVRSPTCFMGYYKQPDKTQEALDSEGWVHTGDIGVLRADGSYRIVDRAKNVFKLAQGEYVAPEKVELAYSLCTLVDQVFVDGDSEKSFLLAVVVPSKEAALKWANAHLANARTMKYEEVCLTHEFRQAVLQQMRQMGSDKGLHGFEQVKEIIVTTEAFTTDNNLITPTLKLKRPQLRKKYADEFKQLYAELESN